MSGKNNNLAACYPELASEWHVSRNDRTPFDVSIGSQYIAWWDCKNCAHIWQAEVRARVGRGTRKGTNCPNCIKPEFAKCLASTHPFLILEWHATKNILTPNDVTFGSNIEIFWVCSKNPEHEWEMKISSRTGKKAQGCPYCARKRVSYENSLAAVNPELASEFHPTKNGTVTTSNIMPGSQKKFWWFCNNVPEHEWKASVANRHLRKSRCPHCFGNTTFKKHRSLAIKYPELIPEWHPVKNGSITPYDVQYGSQKKYWWICSQKHDWEATVLGRSSGFGCPYCSGRKTSIENSIQVSHSEYLEFWDYDRNLIQPDEVSRGSRKIVWWKCDLSGTHSYQAMVCDRIGNENRNGLSCTECHRPAVSDAEIRLSAELNYIFGIEIFQPSYELSEDVLNLFKPKIPDIVSLQYKLIIEIDGANWHDDGKDKKRNAHFNNLGYKVLCLRGKPLNKTTDDDVIFNCRKITLADIKDVLKSISKILGSSIIDPHKKTIENYLTEIKFLNENLYKERKKYINGSLKRRNFLTTHPELSAQWHPTKNNLSPDSFSPCSSEEVWWRCANAHEYLARISHRVYGKDCPKCKSLAFLYPEIAKEWHPKENDGVIPYDIAAGTNKNYTWLCSNGHSWKASPDRRIRENTSCPYCQGRKVSNDNCLATVNPRLASEWHSVKNATLVNKSGELITPNNVTAGQKIKVFWQCNKHPNHEWEATIDSRNRGSGCPICSGKVVHITNCLATLQPKLAQEWHQEDNGNLTPYDVTPGSKYKAFWLCPSGHKYSSLVLSRSHGHGCPECAKKVKSETANRRWVNYRKEISKTN